MELRPIIQMGAFEKKFEATRRGRRESGISKPSSSLLGDWPLSPLVAAVWAVAGAMARRTARAQIIKIMGENASSGLSGLFGLSLEPPLSCCSVRFTS